MKGVMSEGIIDMETITQEKMLALGWRFFGVTLPTEGEDCTVAKVWLDNEGGVEQFLTVCGSYSIGAIDLHGLYEITERSIPVSEFQMWRSNEVPRIGYKDIVGWRLKRGMEGSFPASRIGTETEEHHPVAENRGWVVGDDGRAA